MPARAAPIPAPYASARSNARSARVLGDGDERRRSEALLEQAAHDVARPLRRDHDHVVPRGRRDAPVVDVEAVREEERGAGGEVRRDVLLVHARLHLVGQEQRDDLRAADRVGDGADPEAGLLGRGARRAPLAEADLDVDARVVQVQRVRVALAAVADHGDLAVEQVEVAFAMDRCH